MKSHYLHAHKIKDITSKTIRSNARLFEKYKTENLPEAGLLEILSQQVLQNLQKQSTDVKSIKNEMAMNLAASEKFHGNSQLDKVQLYGESSKVVDKPTVNTEQSSDVILDNVNSEKCIKSHNAIKIEKSFDFESFPYEGLTEIHNSSRIDNPQNQIRIKEEVCDTSFENISNSNQETLTSKIIPKPENQKNRKKQRIRKQPKCDIEKVFVDEQNFSILSTEYDEIIKEEEHIDEFQIIQFEDNSSLSDITFEQNKSDEFSRSTATCTDNLSDAFPAEMTPKQEQRTELFSQLNSFKFDICPNSFKQEIKLELHMNSHILTSANDKLKMCEICGKTYTQSSGEIIIQSF